MTGKVKQQRVKAGGRERRRGWGGGNPQKEP